MLAFLFLENFFFFSVYRRTVLLLFFFLFFTFLFRAGTHPQNMAITIGIVRIHVIFLALDLIFV